MDVCLSWVHIYPSDTCYAVSWVHIYPSDTCYAVPENIDGIKHQQIQLFRLFGGEKFGEQ